MRNILVTGGAGFIGSHACVSLLENNFSVTVLDSYINSSPLVINNIKNIFSKNPDIFKNRIKFFKGDIRDGKSLNSIFHYFETKNNPIQAVIHFAGLKSVEESIHYPEKYKEFNVYGSHNLFNIMEKYNCKNIVFSSSAMVYEGCDKEPLKENSKINPKNPYGKFKLEVEDILQKKFLTDSQNWSIINLRYFNPIGAHCSGYIGENPLGETSNLFPIICNVALKKKNHLKIYGRDWPTRDGTCVRDFIHVMDLADAHVAALKYCFKSNKNFLNINIGTGKGTTILELLNYFEEANKIRIPFIFEKRRSGDVPILVADNELALSTLDWKPIRSLRDMCIDSWLWNKNQFL